MNDFVLWMQKKLKEYGIDPGPLDGIDGQRTRNAINQLFQNLGVKPEEETMEIVLGEDFFDYVREHITNGLNQKEVDYMNVICETFNKYGDGDKRKLAYILATANRESAWKWDVEIWGPTKQQKRYEPGTSLAKNLGNTQVGDGYRFRGRGFVCMITGRRNYEDWSDRLGINIVSNPDIAARPDVAARIGVEGSMKGTFTGRKLSDYINDSKTDYKNARRVINSLDHATEIANVAKHFEKALS